MTDIITLSKAYMISLAENMEQEFTARGLGEPCILTLMPGEEVALDYCLNDASACGIGMAWVRLISVRPADDVAMMPNACYQALSAEFEIGMVRAAPPWDDGPPSATAQMTATMRQLDDASLMLHVLQHTEFDVGETAINPTYTPFGPGGGCYGGTWTGTLRVN